MHDVIAKTIARVRNMSIDAAHVVFPPSCRFCRADLAGASNELTKPHFCIPCRERIVVPIINSCSRCAAPVGPYVSSTTGCQHCSGSRFKFENVFRLGVYDGDLREACLRSKLAGQEDVMAALGEELMMMHHAALIAAAYDLVLPIPQHWSQRLTRPHNPAALLATVLASRLNTVFDVHILVKTGRTPAQKRLERTRRLSNLRHAFRVRDVRLVRNRSVLLADDILTTGTTATEAAGVLRRAGAKTVDVAVIGRVLM